MANVINLSDYYNLEDKDLYPQTEGLKKLDADLGQALTFDENKTVNKVRYELLNISTDGMPEHWIQIFRSAMSPLVDIFLTMYRNQFRFLPEPHTFHVFFQPLKNEDGEEYGNYDGGMLGFFVFTKNQERVLSVSSRVHVFDQELMVPSIENWIADGYESVSKNTIPVTNSYEGVTIKHPGNKTVSALISTFLKNVEDEIGMFKFEENLSDNSSRLSFITALGTNAVEVSVTVAEKFYKLNLLKFNQTAT